MGSYSRRVSSRLSVIIVTWNAADTLEGCLRPLVQQLKPGDELIVSDNASSDATLQVVAQAAPAAIVLQNGGNLGFAAGANRGADAASGDLLVLLNPDTVVAPGWAEAIRRPLDKGYGWDVWQGLVTMDGGRRINTDGNVVHFTGISWAGNAGRAIEEEDPNPREVGYASGACLAVPRDVWRRLGGMPEHFFMYCEDLDLSLRARLAGGKVGIEPSASVDHDYEFAGRGDRWRMLERNRWATILRTYPGPLLALVMPALLMTEVAVLAAAVRGGWAGQKLGATRDVLSWLPRLMSERREIQGERRARASVFAGPMTAIPSSPYLGDAARSPYVTAALIGYWRVVQTLLAR
jgi:GT2 family glycosyltransferase